MMAPTPRVGKFSGGDMPSKSKAQQTLMRAAAHTKGGYGGVPQSVGRDFVAADKSTGKRKLPARKTKPAPKMMGRGLINR